MKAVLAMTTKKGPDVIGRSITHREESVDILVASEETRVTAPRSDETLTVGLTSEKSAAHRPDIAVESAPRLRKKVARATRFSFGLVGLFVVYVTVSLAVFVVVPAVGLGWTSVVITSGSMSPTIGYGDVVIASPSEGKGLLAGTVVVFSDPARLGLVTHRIESINPDGSYVTGGDANSQPDSTPLHPEQVVGVARLVVPFSGLPLVWYWTGAWAKLTIWMASTLLALWLAHYVVVEKHGPTARREENGNVPG